MRSRQPNVVFILADQHNAKCLGHKGHPDVKTPNLDRLAAQGVRFDNAVTQNPICTPSRVSFLSGQYCHNHGYYGLSGPNPQGLPTVLGHFRRHGYTTATVGKIHCPEYWVEDDCDLFHETCDCSINGRSGACAGYLAERGLTDLEDHVALNEFGGRGMQSCEGRPSKVTYRDGQEGWTGTRGIDPMASVDPRPGKTAPSCRVPMPSAWPYLAARKAMATPTPGAPFSMAMITSREDGGREIAIR